jgi:hypothetical protein
MKAGKRLALDNVRDAPLRGPDGSLLKWVGMNLATPRRSVTRAVGWGEFRRLGANPRTRRGWTPTSVRRDSRC